MLIALLTLSTQAIKTALANPVEALRAISNQRSVFDELVTDN